MLIKVMEALTRVFSSKNLYFTPVINIRKSKLKHHTMPTRTNTDFLKKRFNRSPAAVQARAMLMPLLTKKLVIIFGFGYRRCSNKNKGLHPNSYGPTPEKLVLFDQISKSVDISSAATLHPVHTKFFWQGILVSKNSNIFVD